METAETAKTAKIAKTTKTAIPHPHPHLKEVISALRKNPSHYEEHQSDKVQKTPPAYENAPLNVEILASTPNAKAIVFTAIRRCYSALPGANIFINDFAKYEQRTTTDGYGDSERLMRSAMKSGHLSTFEHISFTFAIDNLSRAALAQLTRHRIGFSYSVQSQRYVKHISGSKNGPFNVTIPVLDYIEDDAKKLAYDLLYAANFEAQLKYEKLIEMGVRAEDARCVIPQDMDTNLILTCNLRSLLDFCGKRERSKGAQGEIAKLAERMMELVIEREPWIGRLEE